MTLLQTMKSWSWGEEAQLWKLAEQMQLFDKAKDLWQRWQAVVGFPAGNLAEILKLSDPPYYTACPNPFFQAIIKHYGTIDTYQRVSFASAVSEGRDDPWYKVHSYHTKVPPQAVMRYILHYTQPGDLVFDGFAGSGMTGVAAQLCGERAAVAALWYQVDPAGNILQLEEDAYGKNRWYPFSKLFSMNYRRRLRLLPIIIIPRSQSLSWKPAPLKFCTLLRSVGDGCIKRYMRCRKLLPLQK